MKAIWMPPHHHRPDPSLLLPGDPACYRGPGWIRWTALAYLVPIIIRSLIHMFAADGGAQAIATLPVDGPGGANLIALFGQWGAMQLLLAILLGVLLLRYPGLVPLALLIFLAELALRALMGQIKPVQAAATPPGAIMTWVLLPVLALVLYRSLCPAPRRRA